MTALLLGLIALLLWQGRRGLVKWSDLKVVGLILAAYLMRVWLIGNFDRQIVETAIMVVLGGWPVVSVVRGCEDDEGDYGGLTGDVKPGGFGR